MRSYVGIAIGLLAMVGCDEADTPCTVYVDYMCECHSDDEGFDCDELRATYTGAEPQVQDQCSEDLAAQQDSDEGTDACAA